MTARLEEYHRWMRQYDQAIRAVLDRRAGPDQIGVALQARERAHAALRPPATDEERRVLSDALVDYALAFTGQIESPEADAARRLALREEALATTEPLGAADPSRAQAAVLVGISLVTLGRQPQRAAALLLDGIAVLEPNPHTSVPWLIKARENLGGAQLQLGQWAEAAATFEAVLTAWLAKPPGTQPNEPTGAVTFNLGLANEKLGRWDLARDAYRDATARHLAASGADHPNHVEAQLRLGVVLAKLGETADARALLQRVVEIVARSAGTDHSYHHEAQAALARLA
jgi:tetratricopeptide (TPR) repeat protein